MAVQVESILAGLTDSSGDPLASGKVYTYIAGTTTPSTTWTDEGETTPAANPIVLDAQGRAKVYAQGDYKFVVKDSNDSIIYTWDDLAFFDSADLSSYALKTAIQQSSFIYGGTTAGTANAQTISVSPTPASYVTGEVLCFIAGNSNTDSWTLNKNSLGAKSVIGNVTSGRVYYAVYNGTVYEILNPSCKAFNTISKTTINTTSVSYASMSTDLTGSLVVNSGEMVVLELSGNWSHSSADINSYIEFCDGTTQIEERLLRSSAANTTGAYHRIAFQYIVESPNTGARTYRVRWKTDSGTLYSNARAFTGFTIKK